MYYTYALESTKKPGTRYIGYTESRTGDEEQIRHRDVMIRQDEVDRSIDFSDRSALEVTLQLPLQPSARRALMPAKDHLGTFEVGKLADIVLLDSNPLEDIKNTQAIWLVIKGGWLHDPGKLRSPESAKRTE